jgi:beta-galactosidase
MVWSRLASRVVLCGQPMEGVDMEPRRVHGAVLVLVSVVLAVTAGCASPASAREKFNFNSGWRVTRGDPNGAMQPGFDDSAWKQVATPYAFNEDDAFKIRMNQVYNGVGWYRKHFKVPAQYKGGKVFLEFEGIRQAGEFYLNGKFISRHENGINAFGLDITDTVKFAPEDNVIAARIDSSYRYKEKATDTNFQWNSGDFNVSYGGINKNVYLHVASKVYQTLPLYGSLGTTGVYVYPSAIDVKERSALINVVSQVRNESGADKNITFEISIQDMDGREQGGLIEGPYKLAAGEMRELSGSRRIQNVNFWSWGYGYLYTVTTTLKEDGKVIDVVRTRTGFRKTEFANGLVKLNDRVIQLHGYAQRSTNEWPALGSAVPAWVSDFSNGLVVEGNGNIVRWMHVTPSKQDIESCDRVGLIQSMPAGDKEKDSSGRQWEQRKEAMRDSIIYNRNNPSILFYESGNNGISEEHMKEMKDIRDKYDPHGGRAIGCRNMMGSNVAEYGGEMLYINKSAGKPTWAHEYCRDEANRCWWDAFSPPLFHKDGEGPGEGPSYNRNQDSFVVEEVARWYDYWRERPGTGTRVSSGGANIIWSDSNTHYRGDDNFRRSGEVDAMRLPKDVFFVHAVMWNGWVNPRTDGIYIVGHWNYPEKTTKNVYVVSTAEKVELFVNGKSLGFGQQSTRFLHTFKDVDWQPGVVKAIGYDAAGKKLCQAEKKTAGAPAAIKLTPHMSPNGLIASGGDIALVDVEVVDASGMRCPTAANAIDFELKGPAEWRGGIAKGKDNCILAKTLPVVCGANRVSIRPLAIPGTILLIARAEGLKGATIEMTSRGLEVTDGLARMMPSDGLPSVLTKGPTPAPETLTCDRASVKIVSCSAGSSPDRAAASFDDNEDTAWSTDPNSGSPWIEYTFKSTMVNEVEMKFPSMRNARYPIRITAGETVVFEGSTQPNLGYWHCSFEPVKADSLKVELTGKKGSLRITEMEIYAGEGRPHGDTSTVSPAKEKEYEPEKGGL